MSRALWLAMLLTLALIVALAGPGVEHLSLLLLLDLKMATRWLRRRQGRPA